MNYVVVTLSPKVDGVNLVKDLRPISLLNCIFNWFYYYCLWNCLFLLHKKAEIDLFKNLWRLVIILIGNSFSIFLSLEFLRVGGFPGSIWSLLLQSLLFLLTVLNQISSIARKALNKKTPSLLLMCKLISAPIINK